jgi:hypothetical protein
VLGKYENRKYIGAADENQWPLSRVTITRGPGNSYKWNNEGGESWFLEPNADFSSFQVSSDCPYYEQHRQCAIAIEDGLVVLLGPGDQKITRVGSLSALVDVSAQSPDGSLRAVYREGVLKLIDVTKGTLNNTC